jgi:hypothetical protein
MSDYVQLRSGIRERSVHSARSLPHTDPHRQAWKAAVGCTAIRRLPLTCAWRNS